jgi:hypothetical protein
MIVHVEGPATYAGVRVDHPSIVAAIRALAKQGKPKAEIMRIVGMPGEIVDRYAREVKTTK